MAGARWLRWGSSCRVFGKGEGRCKASNHSSSITPKNQMQNKLISHWLSQTSKQRRIKGGKFPSPPFSSPPGGPHTGGSFRESHQRQDLLSASYVQAAELCSAPEINSQHVAILYTNTFASSALSLPLLQTGNLHQAILSPGYPPQSATIEGVFLLVLGQFSYKAATEHSHVSALQPRQISAAVNSPPAHLAQQRP